jgi:hypothetical protein
MTERKTNEKVFVKPERESKNGNLFGCSLCGNTWKTTDFKWDMGNLTEILTKLDVLN